MLICLYNGEWGDRKSTPLLQQKPRVLIKQKDEKKKATIKNRNAERARQKGIEYIQGVTGVKL